MLDKFMKAQTLVTMAVLMLAFLFAFYVRTDNLWDQLHIAMRKGDIDKVDRMLTRHPWMVNGNVTDPVSIPRKALHSLLEIEGREPFSEKEWEVLRTFEKHGANLKYVDGHGHSYLWHAASYDDPKLIKYFLDRGVPAYSGREYLNERPIVKMGMWEIVNAARALENVKDRGVPDLHYYTIIQDKKRIRKELEMEPAMRYVSDASGRLAYDYARSAENAELKKLLKP